VAIRIAGETVRAELLDGPGMEMRIAGVTHRLVPSVPLNVSI